MRQGMYWDKWSYRKQELLHAGVFVYTCANLGRSLVFETFFQPSGFVYACCGCFSAKRKGTAWAVSAWCLQILCHLASKSSSCLGRQAGRDSDNNFLTTKNQHIYFLHHYFKLVQAAYGSLLKASPSGHRWVSLLCVLQHSLEEMWQTQWPF